MSRRSLSVAVAVVGAAATALVATPGTASPAPAVREARPATTTKISLPAAAATSRAAGATTRLAGRATRDFGLVGVTWARGTGLRGVTVEVRTRAGGSWSDWTALEPDTENDAAGPGTRQGTEPLWVGRADGVAARVRSSAGTPPRDVQVDLVDPGTDPAGTGAQRSAAAAAASPAYTPMPAVIGRSAWGARANKPCDSPRVSPSTSGVIVHHTAGSNSYSRGQSAAIVRGVQAFHMNGRGWCDIGYNYLVDKYGQIFEGRSGGVKSYQVRGAHAGNFTVNTYALGVSMMGNLDSLNPPTAMRSAMVRLIGWRLGTHYLPATGTYPIAGHRLNRIAGHRDVRLSGIRPATATSCPGRYGVAYLPTLRSAVASYISGYSTAIKTKYQSLGASVTGPVYVGEAPITDGGYKTRFTRGDIFFKDDTTGARWITGPVKPAYAALGGAGGRLGFPTSNLNGTGAQQAQRFERGTIYQVSGSAAYALTMKVDDKYRELGQWTSALGAPTSSVVTTSNNVDRAYFEHGAIRYDRDTGEYTVSTS